MKLKFIPLAALSVVLSIFATSCEKAVLPVADFTYEPTAIVQYDVVTFTSTSENATSYLWDFGGGALTSTEQNPSIKFLSTGDVKVKLTVTNEDGENTIEKTITVAVPDNHYTLDGVKIPITTKFFWFKSTPNYLRLLTPITGQTNPDLIKLYPNMGLGELQRTYTYALKPGVEGNYDYGYTGNYVGTTYGWTANSKAGSSNLVIELVDTGVYKITGTMILSVGTWDFSTGLFTETGTKTLKLSYIGQITPL